MIALYLLMMLVLCAAFAGLMMRVTKVVPLLSPASGWFIGLFYFYTLPMLIMTFNGGYRLAAAFGAKGAWASVDLSDRSFFYPYFITWISTLLSCGVSWTYLLYTEPPPLDETNLIDRIDMGAVRRTLLACMVITAVEWTVIIASLGGLDAFFGRHWYGRTDPLLEEMGSYFLVYSKLSQAIQVTFTGAAALYTALMARRGGAGWGLYLLVLVTFVIVMALTGNRIYLALYLLGTATIFFAARMQRAVAVMVALVPVIALAFSVWGYIRANLGNLEEHVTFAMEQTELEGKVINTAMNVTEGMNVVLLMNIPKDFGEKFPYLNGESYSKLVTALIPRSIYPDKIENFSSIAATLYEPGANTSLASTTLGEMYANVGPFTVLLAPVVSLVITALSVWLVRRRGAGAVVMLSSAIGVTCIWAARGTMSDSILIVLFLLIVFRLMRFERGVHLSDDGARP